ncbi:hypothetical protein ACFY3M_52015 [Streptomyces mirabilis]
MPASPAVIPASPFDLEARQPLDVLPGQDAEPLAAWLHGHPPRGGDHLL